jgi:ribose transport system substrate-binding protein
VPLRTPARPARQRVLRRMTPVLAAALLLPAVAACGSKDSGGGDSGSSAGSGSAASSGSDDFLADAKAVLDKGYAGDFDDPPTEGPKAVGGKKVWYVSCGQAFEACVVQSNAFKAAGDALGWDVTIQDGKADPSVTAALIRQAIAAKIDGMAVAYFDCPGIKSALLDAKTAKMPVVQLGSLDCDNEIYQSDDDALFAASPKLRGSTDAAEWYANWARARADYTIAKSEGKAKVLSIFENSQAIQQANGDAFADQMKKCTSCEVKRVPFSFAQVPNPATQQWKSAILSNPTYDIVANGIDAVMFLGLQPAVQAAGREVTVDGAELNPGNIDLIRSGVQRSAAAVPYGWFAWATADTLNRVFAGDDPASFPDEGTGWQFVDKDNNLPSGKDYEPPVDYKAAYEKIWNGS